MRMNKFWSKSALTFVLVTAFLAMQWTTTHAHLSDHRQNESIHHQHQIKAHTHNLAVHHTEKINFSHPASYEHASHENIIEFDFYASFSKREKQKNPSFIVADINLQSLLPSTLTRTKTPFTKTARHSRIYYSPHNPRAPPQTS